MFQLNDTVKLNRIGIIDSMKACVYALVDSKYIPALKQLDKFSHAIFIFSDGSDKLFRISNAEILSVDEKNGGISLNSNCGMSRGNILYDIKPYIPCEDCVPEAIAAINDTHRLSFVPGGRESTVLPLDSLIRKRGEHCILYPRNFADTVVSIKDCSHIKVFWWFSRFDRIEYRRATQGEPPYENAPRTGIFASRSPVRPNPIALTIAKVIEVDEKNRCIEVAGLECFDKTPMICVMPYHPRSDLIRNCRVPKWLAHWPDRKNFEEHNASPGTPLDDAGAQFIDRILGYDRPLAYTDDFWKEDEVQSFEDQIVIRGARQNNLKDIDVKIPKGQITAIAGVSGSGKSSLVFDTVYAESRLRQSEVSDGLERPEVDSITGLPPAVAIAQRAIGRNPRSTVGTFTGIQDRLRLLFSVIGHRHCPSCNRRIQPRTQEEITQLLQNLSDHALKLRPYGTQHVMVSSTIGQTIDWSSVVGEALETGKGAFYLRVDHGNEILLQTRQMCYHCGQILFDLTPATFSFNNPESMCPACSGLGKKIDIDLDLIVSKPHLSLLDGASDYWGDMRSFIQNPSANWLRGELLALAESRGVSLELPWQDLPEAFRHTALYGSKGEKVTWSYVHPKSGRSGTIDRPVEGAFRALTRLMNKGGSSAERIAAKFVRPIPCPTCQGERLRREGRMVTVGGKRFPEATSMSIQQLTDWVHMLPSQLGSHDAGIAKSILGEVYRKLKHIQSMGLTYLALDRPIPTLSGGELQRLKLVSQMGIGLSGLLYVLDEPTAGLHPRDYKSILYAIRRLTEEGNTVLMVEHQEEMLRGADYLIEIGPGSGLNGGRVVWQGSRSELEQTGIQTGHNLSSYAKIMMKRPKLPPKTQWISIKGARGNNLKCIDVTVPKGRITCITGVSGSGKSTLASLVISPAIGNLAAKEPVGAMCESVTGAEGIRGVIHASQTPIGRSSRSTVATYTGIFDEIRTLFAAEPMAKSNSLTASSFSFNSKKGQCDACKGDGFQTIAVPFAADFRLICPVCAGTRYKKVVLKVQYEGKSIHDVLQMPVTAACGFFRGHDKLEPHLRMLIDVGLGYLSLGQNTSTLSGGEAQRLKLAKTLTEQKSGRLLYILDEPTSGLHFSDIQDLLDLMSRLAREGNTILVIEHNLNVIQNADWIIDMGPEGGDAGGEVLIQGTPQQVQFCEASHTGKALRDVMSFS